MAAASYTISLEVVEAVMHNGAPVNNASQVQVPLQRQRRPVYLIGVIYGGPVAHERLYYLDMASRAGPSECRSRLGQCLVWSRL